MNADLARLDDLPLIAILRGLTPEEAPEDWRSPQRPACVRSRSVNSPEPLRSITCLADQFGGRALIGAGGPVNGRRGARRRGCRRPAYRFAEYRCSRDWRSQAGGS